MIRKADQISYSFNDGGNPAWSYSRWRSFRYCPVSYILKYAILQYPQNLDLGEELRRAKKLKTAGEWMEDMLAASLREASTSAGFSVQEKTELFTKILKRDLNRDCKNIEYGNKLNQLEILEIENGIEKETARFLRKCGELLKAFIETLKSSEIIQEILCVGNLNIKRIPSPVSFFHEGFTVWCSPDIAWTQSGKHNTLIFRYVHGELPDKYESPVPSMLCGLMLHKLYKAQVERLQAHEFKFDISGDNEVLSRKADAINFSAVTMYIKECSETIRKSPLPQLSELENFHRKDSAKCRRCKFMRFCNELESPFSCV